MIRTLIFMALLAMSLLTASCCLILPCCGYRGDLKPLDQTTRETLTLVKKEVTSSIMLTNEKVKCKEVEHYVGKESIESGLLIFIDNWCRSLQDFRRSLLVKWRDLSPARNLAGM